MKRTRLLTSIILLFLFVGTAQKTETKIVLITLDGLRWQELYSGADEALITNKKYVHDPTMLKAAFWKDTPEERRETLMPFIWKEGIKIGQLHGNRDLGSKVNLTNTMWFSYPGYNEILTGVADDKRISSNDKINNPNTTVLEIANRTPQYKDKVAAFGSWDVFPFIINEERSRVPVNAGFESATDNLTDKEKFLNQLQKQIPSPWGSVRLDAFTHHYALEHMKKKHPEFIYISYGETDDFAHDGNYQAYLKSAHTTDAMIRELWEFTQQDDFYKDNTVFIVSTDHGRGTEPLDTWRSHGNKIENTGQVWIIAFGKDITVLGEVAKKEQLYSNQIAPTIMKLLDLPINKSIMKGNPLSIMKK